MDSAKEKGYALYDEVNELAAEDYPRTGRDLDEVLNEFDAAGVEILEEPKIEFDSEEGGRAGRLRRTGTPCRLQLKRPTIPSACTCARWGLFRC